MITIDRKTAGPLDRGPLSDARGGWVHIFGEVSLSIISRLKGIDPSVIARFKDIGPGVFVRFKDVAQGNIARLDMSTHPE